jgi:hypothetical protein
VDSGFKIFKTSLLYQSDRLLALIKNSATISLTSVNHLDRVAATSENQRFQLFQQILSFEILNPNKQAIR